MEETAVSSLQLSLDKGNSGREVWDEVVSGHGEHPVDSLSSLSHCIDGWMDGLIEELLIVMKENKFKVLKFIRKKKPHVNLMPDEPLGLATRKFNEASAPGASAPPGRQPPWGAAPIRRKYNGNI